MRIGSKTLVSITTVIVAIVRRARLEHDEHELVAVRGVGRVELPHELRHDDEGSK